MGQATFFLAKLTPLPHNAIMADEASPFSFRVEIDPLREKAIPLGNRRGVSTLSSIAAMYATRRQAKNDALKAMSEIASQGQNKGHD